ncbi:MAG: toxic anion resistance protein [Methylococcaceae bacterium]|nr:toxic anion resistance protein [Methylococcaceae bacterium]
MHKEQAVVINAGISPDLNLPGHLPELDWEDYGLSHDDRLAVDALAHKIDERNPLSVAEFGHDIGEHTASYTDELLDQVKNADLEELGDQLSILVVSAKQINLSSIKDNGSKIPIIGRYLDRAKINKERLIQQFDSTKTQIDKLLQEVAFSRKGLMERITALESMFGSVKEEHRLLGLHIAAGKLKLDALQLQLSDRRREKLTQENALAISELEQVIAYLDKRVTDLQMLQHSALQSLPMIRMIQANNRMLSEKLYTIYELTIPSWKRNFLLIIALYEQAQAFKLSQNIDNATNLFLTRNAQLLAKNAKETTLGNQRLVIDIETLEKVQALMIDTVQQVIRIQEEGVRTRKATEVKLRQLRGELKAKQISHNGLR